MLRLAFFAQEFKTMGPKRIKMMTIFVYTYYNIGPLKNSLQYLV